MLYKVPGGCGIVPRVLLKGCIFGCECGLCIYQRLLSVEVNHAASLLRGIIRRQHRFIEKEKAVSTQDMKNVRDIARKLSARVKTDQAFREQLEKDPVGILTQEGLPENVVDDFLRETGLADVSGYVMTTLPLSQVCMITVV